MVLLRFLSLGALALLLSGCQMGYYVKSAYNHLSMMSRRQPIARLLEDPSLDPDVRRKLGLAVEAHEYGVAKMGLRETSNYTTYVRLDRPYVSWVVSAAPRWRLEHHKWNYLFVGSLPYKGFFSEEDAKAEQKALEARDLDTFVRGVSAYSTVGWFQDSVLSSMLRANDFDLVNTIIHESVHTTLYIKSSADFNERLAVFVGNRGTEQFYRAKEGEDSATVREIRAENEDDRAFSAFIGPQLESLKAWYASLPESSRDENARRARLHEIQDAFKRDVLPRLKTKAYRRFAEVEINNARLMVYRTYMQDLGDFESLYALSGEDWSRFFACAKTLEKAEKPEEALKELNRRLTDAEATARAGICAAG